MPDAGLLVQLFGRALAAGVDVMVEAGGRTLSYGSGSGHPRADAPTILFIHGAGFDHAVWVMPARYFARHGYRVIALDLPAHGRSPGPALDSIEAMADCVADVIGALAPTPAIVVGHSMGSLVALACASRHADKVERMVLNSWSHSHRGSLGSARNPGMHNLHSGERWLERMADGVYHTDLAACNAFDGDIEMPSVPALVIAGSEDRMTPARAGLGVAERLEQVTTLELAGAGHAMLSEQPNEVLDALAGFIVHSND